MRISESSVAEAGRRVVKKLPEITSYLPAGSSSLGRGPQGLGLGYPVGATVGDLLTKPVAKGGLALGTMGALLVLLTVLFALMRYAHVRERRKAALPVLLATGRA